MNEIKQMELITLQGIFADSFEQLDDETIKFTF